MNAPEQTVQFQLAISRALEARLTSLDEAQYQTFLEAVAFAERILPLYLAKFTDFGPLMVPYRDVALLIGFSKKLNRYYVGEVVFGDDNSPYPGAATQSGRSPYWWADIIVPLSRFDGLGAANRDQSDVQSAIASFKELVAELQTPLGIRAQGAFAMGERGSSPRSNVFTGPASVDAPP